MKLNARKSIAAMGTALALSITPVAVPSMAPTAFAAVSETNYNTRKGNVESGLTTVNMLLAGAREQINKTTKAVSGVDDAELKVSQANTQFSIAEGLLKNAQDFYDSVKDQPASDDNYGVLGSATTALNDAKTALSRVDTRLGEARAAKKKAEDSKFSCPNAVNKTDGKNGDDDSSSSGSSTDSFNSSGNRIVYKGGKKECVSNREYYTDMLTKLVAVLGTIFTLITTVTKISDVMMKNNPMMPPAA